MSELKTELRQLISEVGEVPGDFNDQAHFYRELGMGSFKSVDLLMALEDRYHVQIPDEQYLDATSLNRLTSMMEGLIGG